MEEPSQVRRAAREAVEGTTPERLRTRILRVLEAGSMAPGVLTLLSARAAASENAETDGGREGETATGTGSTRSPMFEDPTDEALAMRAAGVQLIYEGLRLTRTLASEEPWTHEGADRTAADIAILAADVLVARGFYLLARTEVAPDAVETVRRFGQDQTRRRDPGTVSDETEDLDRTLEVDALALAVRCGVTAVGSDVPAGLRTFVADLAVEADEADEEGFPAPEDFFSPSVRHALVALIDGRTAGVTEGVPPVTDR